MAWATRRDVIIGASAAAAITPAAAMGAKMSPTSARTTAAANELIKRLFATKLAPALSMAVARPAGLVWASALGDVDLELGVPASPMHTFRLGSVSKVVTATVAARLATRGVFDLDAPIAKWLTNLPEQHRNTTMRQLLTHRGGVRHFNAAERDVTTPGGPIYMRIYPGDTDILKLFINDALIAAPGTSVNYSSYGYTLASLVMQGAARTPFLELVQREVSSFVRLPSLTVDDPWALSSMAAGKYMNDLDVKALCAGLPEHAKPKLTNGWAKMPFSNPAYSWAGAGFLMTPLDAARFGASLLDSPGSSITPEQRALLFTPTTEAAPSSPPLGLGWRIDSDKKGRRRWQHSGATPGGCYFLAIYPDAGLSVSLAANVMTARINAPQAAADLMDAFTA